MWIKSIFKSIFTIIPTLLKMASSLISIADSLVPEDQRKKKVDSDDEFHEQLEKALKLSMEENKPTAGAVKVAKTKNKKVVKLQERTFLETNDVTQLSFADQLEYVKAKSKFDVDTAPPIDSNSESMTSEEDQFEIALELSKDPYEQLNREQQDLLKALEVSKLDAENISDSDSYTSNSSAHIFKRPAISERASCYRTDFLRPLSINEGSNQSAINDSLNSRNNNNLESEDEEEAVYLAKMASLGHDIGSITRRKPNNNSYVAAAKKAPKNSQFVAAGRSKPGKNCYADPTRLISSPKPPLGPTSRRRPIIVDGCNVAFQHGKNDRYSAMGLKIVYEYFVNNFGYTENEITIVNKFATNLPSQDQAIIDWLQKIDVLIFSPSRRVGGTVIISDDDLFVLNLAKQKNGVVVSLDQFRDAYSKTTDKELKKVIKYSILQFSFKGDEIHFPDDPLGAKGPRLKEFLNC